MLSVLCVLQKKLFCMSSGDSSENCFAADRDEYGADTMTEIHIVGRITLNLWRVMKTEAGFLVPSPPPRH